jgi:phosphoglycerate dehydrogenase-like enzyme
MQVGFAGTQAGIEHVYGVQQRLRLQKEAVLLSHVVTLANWDELFSQLQDLEAIFSTWGLEASLSEKLATLPRLKAVFYAAGSVRHFAAPLLERGIEVYSAWAANAVPVAEFTLSQILLANKGYFRNVREYNAPEMHAKAFRGRGNFATTVSLLGAGMIARNLIEKLAAFDLKVLVFDPFLSAGEAARLGVEKVELPEAFARGDVVSNHVANVPATVNLIRAEHLRAMPHDATFINTGRGATVCEPDLIEVMRERPDLTALLDVTEPEPPAAGSPLYTLPNVWLSSHIAGAIGNETHRLADWMIDEFVAWRSSQPTRFRITSDMMERLA